MKTLIKYIIIAFVLFAQLSCDKWMEIYPPNGLIRDEFWKKKEDVEAVLMSAYSSFASMDKILFLHGELRGDLLLGGSNQPDDEQNIMENNIYPDNKYCNWISFYKVINLSNEVIKNAPLVFDIDNTFTEYQLKSIVSEAYFIRSLCYFYLVRIYKEVPLLLEPAENDNVNIYLPKTTEEVILEQIVKDLKANREFAPSGSFASLEESKGRASKAAYDALLADIELWRFNYEEVLIYVNKIELNKEIVLMPQGKWFQIFYPGNSLEGIFEFQFESNLAEGNNLANLTNRTTNQYYPSQKATEMFSFNTSKETVRGEDSSIGIFGENSFVIWKYVGQAPDSKTMRSGSNFGSANLIVYRLADVLLMKAEALAMLNRFSESNTIINKIRERAGVAALSISNTTVAYEDAIMQERALELAYEGKRWFDLLRMGRRNNFARKDKLIEVVVSNVPSTQKRILAAKLTNPLGWYLPIYGKEIERNRNLVQNPFYIF